METTEVSTWMADIGDSIRRVDEIDRLLEEHKEIIEGEWEKLFMPFTYLQGQNQQQWEWADSYISANVGCGCGYGYSAQAEMLAAIIDAFILKHETGESVFYEYGPEGKVHDPYVEGSFTLMMAILDGTGVTNHGSSHFGAWLEVKGPALELFTKLWRLLDQDDFSEIRRAG